MSNRYLKGMCIACMILFSLHQETNLHAQEDALDVVPLSTPKGWKGKITYKETQTLELKGKKITEGVSVAASYKFPIELIVEMHVHFLNPYGGAYHKDKNPEFYNVKYDSKYTGVCDTRHKEKVCCGENG